MDVGSIQGHKWDNKKNKPLLQFNHENCKSGKQFLIINRPTKSIYFTIMK